MALLCVPQIEITGPLSMYASLMRDKICLHLPIRVDLGGDSAAIHLDTSCLASLRGYSSCLPLLMPALFKAASIHGQLLPLLDAQTRSEAGGPGVHVQLTAAESLEAMLKKTECIRIA
jgi:hypothetical protein